MRSMMNGCTNTRGSTFSTRTVSTKDWPRKDGADTVVARLLPAEPARESPRSDDADSTRRSSEMSTWLEKAGVATRRSSVSVSEVVEISVSKSIRPSPSAIMWLSKNRDRYPVACRIKAFSCAVLRIPNRSRAATTPWWPWNSCNALYSSRDRSLRGRQSTTIAAMPVAVAFSRRDRVRAEHASNGSRSRRLAPQRRADIRSPQCSREGRSGARGSGRTSTSMVSTGEEYLRCVSTRQCNWFQRFRVPPSSSLFLTRRWAASRYANSRRCSAVGWRMRNRSTGNGTSFSQAGGGCPPLSVHAVLWPVIRSVTSSSMAGDTPNDELLTTLVRVPSTVTTRSAAASRVRKLRMVACSTRDL